MGRRNESGGVREKAGKCQVEVRVDGVRHRISTPDAYNAGNVKRWRSRLLAIHQRVNAGTFVWEDEFPTYKRIGKVAPARAEREAKGTYNAVADLWEKTLTEPSFAWSTIYSYKRINRARWRKLLGNRQIGSISAAELKELVAKQKFATVKSHNNSAMVLKCVFNHAADMEPPLVSPSANPAAKLEFLKLDIQLDHRMVYDLDEAEFLIGELGKDWGPYWKNFYEFAFFGGGMRPSEQVALLWSDLDEKTGKILVTRVRVMGKSKNCTKNNTKRWVKLSPRALEILKRQRRLTGALPHQHIFTHADGKPLLDRESAYRRWYKTHHRLTKKDPKFHFRPPYAARHSSVTWHLMIGRSDRWTALNHGHSVAVLHKVYAHWLASDEDEGELLGAKALEIRRAFGYPLPVLQHPGRLLAGGEPRRASPRTRVFEHRAAAR